MRGAGEQGDVLEGAVALVAEEEVGLVVVGDVDVLPAVVVDVAEDHAKAGPHRAAEAGGLGRVLERAVPPVAVEAAGQAGCRRPGGSSPQCLRLASPHSLWFVTE